MGIHDVGNIPCNAAKRTSDRRCRPMARILPRFEWRTTILFHMSTTFRTNHCYNDFNQGGFWQMWAWSTHFRNLITSLSRFDVLSMEHSDASRTYYLEKRYEVRSIFLFSGANRNLKTLKDAINCLNQLSAMWSGVPRVETWTVDNRLTKCQWRLFGYVLGVKLVAEFSRFPPLAVSLRFECINTSPGTDYVYFEDTDNSWTSFASYHYTPSTFDDTFASVRGRTWHPRRLGQYSVCLATLED